MSNFVDSDFNSWELPQVPVFRVFDAETLEEEEPIFDKDSQFSELLKRHWLDMTTDGKSLHIFSAVCKNLRHTHSPGINKFDC